MITKKLKHSFKFDDELRRFQTEFNHVVRYAFNRYSDSKGILKDSEIEQLVKRDMNNVSMLDGSFVKQAVLKAKAVYQANKDSDGACGPVIFGGRYNFRQRSRKNIMREEFRRNTFLPIRCVGGKSDRGNRKFEIDLRNHRVIFKKDNSHHYEIKLSAYSKDDERLLFALQDKHDSDSKSVCFTVELDEDYVYLTFDELEYSDDTYQGIHDRVASIDMNPNYIALVIQDKRQGILVKRLYSVKDLNDLDDQKRYKYKQDKKKWRKYLNNKKKHETLHISKDIVKVSRHYRVESFVIENLDIKSKDSDKGRKYNKLVLNHWQRNLLFNNLHKRCNLSGIEFVPVWAGYSSIKGQLEHDDEIDSIAAAIEIGNRKGKNLKEFGDTRVELGRLSNRWKNEIAGNFKRAPSWKQVSEYLKRDSTPSYRNLFSETNSRIRVSHSLSSPMSCVKLYDFI